LFGKKNAKEKFTSDTPDVGQTTMKKYNILEIFDLMQSGNLEQAFVCCDEQLSDYSSDDVLWGLKDILCLH
jgi:hypothetical protein